jgi:trigger factor
MAKKLSTSTEFEQTSPTTWHVAIRVPSEKFKMEQDKIYRDLATNTNIPGFRPGKAPKNILNRHFGKEQILADSYEKVIESTIWPALREKEFTIVGQPRIDFEPWTDGSEFNYRAIFEIVPPIPDIDYESITSTLPVREVTDEILLEELRRLGMRLGESKNITDRTVKNGDLLMINFNGEAPDVTINSLKGEIPWQVTNEMMEVEVGAGKAIIGLDEHLVGMELEEIKEFEFELPDDFSDHRVRGKTIQAKVRLRGIKEITPLKLTDEIIREKFNEQGLENLDDLREKMKAEIETEFSRSDGNDKADQLETSLSIMEGFPLPENLVRSKFAELIDRTLESLNSEGKDTSDLMKEDNEKGIKMRKRARYQAERMVRLDLITREIARKESIDVRHDEVANYLMMVGMRQGLQEKDIKSLLKDPQFVEGTRNDILRKKVTSFLLEKMQVERVSEEKFRGFLDTLREGELSKEKNFVDSIDDPLATFEIDYLGDALKKVKEKTREKTEETVTETAGSTDAENMVDSPEPADPEEKETVDTDG